nr:putative reverse transcriptase domain-containing protein [Tanacetum cinerariifolium]
MKLNLTQPRWDATDFLFKEDYTIVHKPRAVIYRDRNNQKKMMRETKVHKFSDGTLTRILKKLDLMVKDFELFKFNPRIENRIWTEDDKQRSQEFIKLIERRIMIRRIFKSLKILVSGRLNKSDMQAVSRHVVNSNVIHVESSKIEALMNWKASKTPSDIRSFPRLVGKANVVTDTLSRKKRVKPKRVRAMSMTIQSIIMEKLLTAQNEATKEDNVPRNAAWLESSNRKEGIWRFILYG